MAIVLAFIGGYFISFGVTLRRNGPAHKKR